MIENNSLLRLFTSEQFTISSFRCESKDFYFDIQQFVEDSFFEFINASDLFGRLCQDFGMMLSRNDCVSSKLDALSIVQFLDIDSFSLNLDLPYLYTGVSADLGVLVLDNGFQYLSIFINKHAV